MKGESKGAAFLSFEKREEAEAALELDKTKLKSKVLVVELSTGKNFKPTATVYGKGLSASPAPDADGDAVMSGSPAPEARGSTRQEIENRTITLMNVPDTVNVARIRAISEPYGDIVKLTLRPDHQGAIIEYADAATAGKAALGLENHEIAEGRRIRTGGLKELFAEKDEVRNDLNQNTQGKKSTAAFITPAPPVRRPVGPGGRGGLGQKKGLGFSATKAGSEVRADAADSITNGNGDANRKPKSNADFKAMFVSGGTQ